MSTPLPQAPQYLPQMPVNPPKPKKKFNWKIALLVFAAVLIGGLIGSASNPAPPPVETIREVEKRVEVKVPVVPSECLVAFGHAEDLFSSAGRVSDVFKDAIDAVSKMNVPGINAATEKIEAENAIIDISGTKYVTAKNRCLAG